MVTFNLTSSHLFLASYNEGILNLYEFYNPDSAIIKRTDLMHISDVGPNRQYDALEISGVVISGPALTKLAAALYQTRLNVNREGFCYLYVEGVIKTTFKTVCYRLNDLFDWSEYGVQSPVTMTWNRCALPKGTTVIDYEDQTKSLEQSQNDVKKKMKEIKSLKDQVSAVEAELKCTKSELDLSKEHIADLQTKLKNNQISASEDSVKQLNRKHEEMEKLQSELPDAKAELKLTKSELELSKAKVAELQGELNRCRVESELKFTKGELDSLKTKVAALQMEMNQYRAEAELKSAKSELESSKAEVVALQMKLNQCHAQSGDVVAIQEDAFRV